ncbi:unnamed protein product [Medioppia subpectinata]|uniref:Carboxylic ester hydrolase n=1 Tax=Medioppia subpectinata TaxID=1979941 RepID=A0A7R9KUX6_9ACAR|nr:unnamed protein product [Medioppia subpectinata]CAG2109122.1 unnamed protein product [Medioppia subpectinata]
MYMCCVCNENTIDVTTSLGVVRGQTSGLHVLNQKIHQFLNIPYAEPPLGRLRFARPLPLKSPKKEIIDATKRGNACIQRISMPPYLFQRINISEDCLVLNIWTPNGCNINHNQRKSNLKAVMFMIHHGGLSAGSIFVDINNLSVLAVNDMVLVAINYRLGPLGFLYGSDETTPGNVGFYDQLLALKWVRQNIDGFGGDRDRITIFGSSAGSWSVSAHILSPLSKGLFKRAIMQSGALIYNKLRPAVNTTKALIKAKTLAQRLNCTKCGGKWLDCLRAINDSTMFIDKTTNAILTITRPVFGTEFLPLIAQKAFETNLYNSDVELMGGLAKDEGSLSGVWTIPELNNEFTEHLFRKLINKLNAEYYNIDVNKITDYYLKSVNKANSAQLKAAFIALLGDLFITCPTYHFAKKFTKINTNIVYYYRFNHVAKFYNLVNQCDGNVCHGSELVFIFGFSLQCPKLVTYIEYNYTIGVMKIWANFAKTGFFTLW